MRNLSHFQSLVILSFLIFIYLIHYQSYEFLNDDAFISFRFSWNWAYHGEIVYNLGEKVEGYTNFLWVALGALILKLGGDLPTWANHLGLLFGTLTLLSLYLFRSRSKSESESESLITIFLLVSSPAYAAWSSGGLETQLFTFCFTLSWLYLLKAIESQSQNQYRLSGILMALSSMTRPEGMVLFVITAFYLGIRWLLNREKIMGFVIAFTLIFIPFYAWKWHYYGYPFPNTYYVKVGATGAWKPGLLYFGDWVLVHPWVLLPLLYLVWIGFKSLKDLIQPKYLLWAYAVFICVHVMWVEILWHFIGSLCQFYHYLLI
jgi:arabinofuranosyltransferase